MSQFKISVKLVALSVVLAAGLSSTALLPGDFSAYGAAGAVPADTEPVRSGEISGKPLLTWEKIKELTGGTLSYQDIRDSFYSMETGSGLYILCFPIKDAKEFSLIASSAGPDARPMAIKLHLEPAGLSLDLNAENLGTMMALYNGGSSLQEINKLFDKEIPVPENAKTYGNIIYLSGRAPDEIVKDYGNMLLDSGWKLKDALGMKRFYIKSINGCPVVISVLCTQEGGRQDPDILTVIRINREDLPAGKDSIRQDEQDVRKLVEAFGKKLGKVSPAAPRDTAAESIKKNYSAYVTPQLLQKWQAQPQNAPGCTADGRWPDRIDIQRTERVDKDRYIVYGEIIEVTGTGSENAGAAAMRPVTAEVLKVNSRWLISSVTVDGYVQRGPVAYKNTRYGFRFYLPQTWKGYSVVEEKWEGTSGAAIAASGPELLIRHPAWTQEKPRQDIPIMVFTLEQWNALHNEEFFVSAAPVGPTKLGSNQTYVFALPARYNYAFPEGFEEVEEILENHPLWPDYFKEEKVKFEAGVIVKPIEIKPLPETIKPGPEFIERIKKSKEELQKSETGLFDTQLSIKQEDSRVRLDFSLQNVSGKLLPIYFSSGQKFDIFIKDHKDNEIYTWSHNKGFITAIVKQELKKDEKLSFSEIWDCRDNDGNIVLPGKYSVEVKLLAKPEKGKLSDPVELSAHKDIILE